MEKGIGKSGNRPEQIHIIVRLQRLLAPLLASMLPPFNRYESVELNRIHNRRRTPPLFPRDDNRVCAPNEDAVRESAELLESVQTIQCPQYAGPVHRFAGARC